MHVSSRATMHAVMSDMPVTAHQLACKHARRGQAIALGRPPSRHSNLTRITISFCMLTYLVSALSKYVDNCQLCEILMQ